MGNILGKMMNRRFTLIYSLNGWHMMKYDEIWWTMMKYDERWWNMMKWDTPLLDQLRFKVFQSRSRVCYDFWADRISKGHQWCHGHRKTWRHHSLATNEGVCNLRTRHGPWISMILHHHRNLNLLNLLLFGGFNPTPLKNHGVRQLGSLFPIYGKS